MYLTILYLSCLITQVDASIPLFNKSIDGFPHSKELIKNSTDSFNNAIRKSSLPNVEKLPLPFGSKEVVQHKINPIRLLDGLALNNGIFFFFKPYPHYNPPNLLYADQQGNILFRMRFQQGVSVFQARTDVLIFEATPLNYAAVPQAYHAELPNDRCWILKKGKNLLAFTFDNLSLTVWPAEPRGMSDKDMLNLFRSLARILPDPQQAIYYPERAKELRSQLLKKLHQEREKEKRKRERIEKIRRNREEKLSPGYGIPRYASSRFNQWLSVFQPGKQFKDFNAYYASLNLPCIVNLLAK